MKSCGGTWSPGCYLSSMVLTPPSWSPESGVQQEGPKTSALDLFCSPTRWVSLGKSLTNSKLQCAYQEEGKDCSRWSLSSLFSLTFYKSVNYYKNFLGHSESEVAQSCLTLCDPVDCSPPGSSIHGILQARILEWVAISFSRGSSQPRDRTQVSRIARRGFGQSLQKIGSWGFSRSQDYTVSQWQSYS